MSLLDAYEPCTRRDISDYGIDEPIMDLPYGNAADHASAAGQLAANRAERIERHRAAMIRAGREPRG